MRPIDLADGGAAKRRWSAWCLAPTLLLLVATLSWLGVASWSAVTPLQKNTCSWLAPYAAQAAEIKLHR